MALRNQGIEGKAQAPAFNPLFSKGAGSDAA
jgi:hypothetical protein